MFCYSCQSIVYQVVLYFKISITNHCRVSSILKDSVESRKHPEVLLFCLMCIVVGHDCFIAAIGFELCVFFFVCFYSINRAFHNTKINQIPFLKH